MQTAWRTVNSVASQCIGLQVFGSNPFFLRLVFLVIINFVVYFDIFSVKFTKKSVNQSVNKILLYNRLQLKFLQNSVLSNSVCTWLFINATFSVEESTQRLTFWGGLHFYHNNLINQQSYHDLFWVIQATTILIVWCWFLCQNMNNTRWTLKTSCLRVALHFSITPKESPK